MSDFATVRFDDRERRPADDGRDFEAFVLEYLQRKHGVELVRSLATGNDGAIDISEAHGPISSIAECKFISKNAKDGPADRWSGVKVHLNKNLPAAARGEGGHAARYRLWLASRGLVKHYRFCTPALMGTVEAHDTLRQSIEEFFQEIADKHDELEHLAEIEVEVLFWDDFIGDAGAFPALFYRWFGGLPPGVNEIEFGFGREGSFKRFLDSKALPYFSRIDYAEASGRAVERHEAALAAQLAQGEPSPALVLSGPGGVGKTRLAVELCARLEAMGWYPLCLERTADPQAVDEVAKAHADPARLAAFVDYGEVLKGLEQAAELVRRLGAKEHEVRLIVSCRHSGLQRVTDDLADLDPDPVLLDSAVATPEGYDAWVVAEILRHFAVPRAAEVVPLCAGSPVFAAFAGFLFRRDAEAFRRQFGELVGVGDFTNWANRRIAAITAGCPDRTAAERALAEIAILLPMPRVEVEALEASPLNYALLEILIAGWARENAIDEDAIFRVSRISRYLRLGGAYAGGDVRGAVLGAAWTVLAARNPSAGWPDRHSRLAANLLLANLAAGLGEVTPYGGHVARLFAELVRTGHVFYPGCGFWFTAEFEFELRVALDSGLLYPVTDAESIAAFRAWARSGGEELEEPDGSA